jgi:hypothetical protein
MWGASVARIIKKAVAVDKIVYLKNITRTSMFLAIRPFV